MKTITLLIVLGLVGLSGCGGKCDCEKELTELRKENAMLQDAIEVSRLGARMARNGRAADRENAREYARLTCPAMLKHLPEPELERR